MRRPPHPATPRDAPDHQELESEVCRACVQNVRRVYPSPVMSFMVHREFNWFLPSRCNVWSQAKYFTATA
jgi:hypothetical protein